VSALSNDAGLVVTVHHGRKKDDTKFVTVTLSNLNRFWKFFQV